MANATLPETTTPDAEAAFPDQTPAAPADTAKQTEPVATPEAGFAPGALPSDPSIGAICNRTIFTGDNLHVLRRMDSDSVDLIYLDPPFNSNKMWSAPIGSKAAGAAFKDAWTLDDVDLAWHEQLEKDDPALHQIILAAREARGDGTMSYLIYMAPRLEEMRRVLKPTGSIYLHCDPTESHSLKLMMDAIFGANNFLNEIVWWYYNVAVTSKKSFGHKHDIILAYTKSDTWTFNPDAVRIPYSETSNWVKNPEAYKDKYAPHKDGKLAPDVFHIPTLNNMAKERVGYPTQKPTKLLERIIEASSNPGDVVLDPFAGCATAAIAAENLGRRWVGIDISEECARQAGNRLAAQLGLTSEMVIHRTDLPKRTDQGDIPRYNSPENKKALWAEQEGHCTGCGGFFPPSGMQVDHFIPESKGGTDHIDNLQLLCGGCNATKGDRPMSYLTAKKLAERGITYGGKVTAIVEAEEAKQAVAATEAAPDSLKELLAAEGLDLDETTPLLTEFVKVVAAHKAKEDSNDK